MRKELRTKNNSLRLQQRCRSEVSPDRGRAREVKLKRSALYKDRHQPSICPLILASTVSSSAACAALALSGPVCTGQSSREAGGEGDGVIEVVPSWLALPGRGRRRASWAVG